MKKLFSALLLSFAATALFAQKPAHKPIDYVNPFIGTAATGHTFPGACLPFGLIQASPVTGAVGWQYCSEYIYADTRIWGFSQTHLNGTGRPAMGDLSLMPFVGDFDETGLASPFRKETQFCAPDHYAVTLDRGGVRAEATTSPRVAWWRFTFPAGARHWTTTA